MGNKNTDKTEKTEKTEAFTVKKLAEWISIKKIAVAVGFAFFASMVPNWLLAFIARPSGDDYGYSAASHHEYYGTAEPPVRCGESHLSGLMEPPHFVY